MSEEEYFQKAKDHLIPRDIYLRDSKLHFNKNFEPKYYIGQLASQLKFQSKGTQTATITEKQGEKEVSIRLFRAEMELGVRIVDPQISSIEDQDSEKALDCIKAELTGNFIAEYIIDIDDIESEALKLFADRNVTYHIWPFWREFVMDMMQRSRLPRVVMPTLQI
ncbi:MAG: hypothetical protein JAY85_06065 [Candidatus Thiodiazotropha weberae]|uniref:Preprotein translocase subunit SecB n=1 Tax=Candidatus Thiodiazotropha endoloripes TaxID=1818881 RepID=A0A1E2USM1_9GAMM|nr:hypothetical protein [Candidatus Thiodiazotropha endoloripes]MCG7898006.1 hypothetical protein [Candidatus Thiodiazotropha weberae]ODB86453.1 hypothetical protein A3195_12650 [Candidatus Thiodiazotropha endoloripes]ODB88482.1 hypothetical protein A3193_06435 [Candidatus Thiodiazotropha endoloripes]ODB97572.1 hypothetical protein A3196_12880 [Candidatus Thiodiazotropha endoloripes]